MEGVQPAEAAQHIAWCRQCRSLIGELEAIRIAARELAEQVPEPPARLWTAIQSRLEAEGLIRRRSWFERLGDWAYLVPRPALAGVCFAVLFVLAAIRGLAPQGGMPNLPEMLATPGLHAEMLQARATMDRIGRRATTTMEVRDPVVAASYRENLAIVEKLIVQCERAVREQPDNSLAREYLYTAWQQKAELVAAMTERGTVSGE
jgi:hypothetical protein